jgi:hypothetical protein
MKVNLAVLLITANSHLAQSQQALPGWRENRGRPEVEDAKLLPVQNAAAEATEQIEGARMSRSITFIRPPRSRGSIPAKRTRRSAGSAGQATVDNTKQFTAARSRAGAYGVYSFEDGNKGKGGYGSVPGTRFRGSAGQATVDNTKKFTAARSRADYGKGKDIGGYGVKGKGGYGSVPGTRSSGSTRGSTGQAVGDNTKTFSYGVYSFEASSGKGKEKGKGMGKGKSKGVTSKQAKSKGE